MVSKTLTFLSVTIVLVQQCLAFMPSPTRITKLGSQTYENRVSSALMGAANPDRTAFGSKLLPDFTEEELKEMFKEFNITSFDLNKDPELV